MKGNTPDDLYWWSLWEGGVKFSTLTAWQSSPINQYVDWAYLWRQNWDRQPNTLTHQLQGLSAEERGAMCWVRWHRSHIPGSAWARDNYTSMLAKRENVFSWCSNSSFRLARSSSASATEAYQGELCFWIPHCIHRTFIRPCWKKMGKLKIRLNACVCAVGRRSCFQRRVKIERPC